MYMQDHEIEFILKEFILKEYMTDRNNIVSIERRKARIHHIRSTSAQSRELSRSDVDA